MTSANGSRSAITDSADTDNVLFQSEIKSSAQMKREREMRNMFLILPARSAPRRFYDLPFFFFRPFAHIHICISEQKRAWETERMDPGWALIAFWELTQQSRMEARKWGEKEEREGSVYTHLDGFSCKHTRSTSSRWWRRNVTHTSTSSSAPSSRQCVLSACHRRSRAANQSANR